MLLLLVWLVVWLLVRSRADRAGAANAARDT
jgi:hypothetical protein